VLGCTRLKGLLTFFRVFHHLVQEPSVRCEGFLYLPLEPVSRGDFNTMKFIDEAKIFVKGGDGGRGCMSFRREKYVPRGGPDGGDGGKGGDVIIRASRGHHTLLDLKFNQHHVADRGAHGEGAKRTGRSGRDEVIIVPVGTVIHDAETGEVLADLTADGETYIAARGGIGGRGNARFATPTRQAPRHTEPGRPGEERWILLELKLLADVGIIGLPNVGKSTFISRVSSARPRIADYPFTTLVPNLGVVRYQEDRSFVIADIPGLIEGAHAGTGLGTRFLRHIERTRLLLHMIDIAGETPAKAWKNFEVINRELALYGASLKRIPQIVALNKTDIPATRDKMEKVIDIFRKKGLKIFPVSAVTGEGVKALLAEMVKKLEDRGLWSK
jgi:GTP-binding protein